MSDEDFRLLSLREAGELLGIEARAVKALIETGEIGAYRTGVSGQYRMPRVSLLDWLERIAQAPNVARSQAPPPVEPVVYPSPKVRSEKPARERIGTAVRFAILRRSGFKCVYCGKPASEGALQVDHVVPVSKGGSSEPDNLVAACRDCNSGKQAKLLDPSEVVMWTRS